MALTISLRADTEKRLEEQARAAGVDKSTYAAQLLERSLLPDDWLEKLSGDVGKRFAESGMSEEELGEELERAKHEMRAERRRLRGLCSSTYQYEWSCC